MKALSAFHKRLLGSRAWWIVELTDFFPNCALYLPTLASVEALDCRSALSPGDFTMAPGVASCKHGESVFEKAELNIASVTIEALRRVLYRPLSLSLSTARTDMNSITTIALNLAVRKMLRGSDSRR